MTAMRAFGQAAIAVSTSLIASAGEAASCGQYQTVSGRCSATQAANLRAFVDCGDERKPCR